MESHSRFTGRRGMRKIPQPWMVMDGPGADQVPGSRKQGGRDTRGGGMVGSMENIYVEKDELLEKIQANRDDHRRIFEEALEGFQAKVTAELQALIKRARAGLRETVSLRFVAPEDHTRDYDRVIAMVEMNVDSKVELSEEDFTQYVMDDWRWQGAFLANTYGSRSASEKFAHTAYTVS